VSDYANQIGGWLRENAPEAQLLRYDTSVHSVEEAVSTSGLPLEEFTKSIAMISPEGEGIVAVVPATKRASTDRVKKALALTERPRLASPEDSLALLGQDIGGNSPLMLSAIRVLVDPLVLEREWIVVGGGHDRTLVRISVSDFERVPSFDVARVRK